MHMNKRVDRNENLNQTYMHAMWTQNATNSTPLYARSTATVNMSNHVGFQHFPGVDCYSHQGQLLRAGCWKELTETKTWIKHILACHVNAKCNKLDASTCIIHCHCEHVKPCWFSTFSWWRLLQPPGTAATGWMLKTIHLNKKTWMRLFSDHHECDPLAILQAPFSTFNTCFCRNGKNCQIIILKNV